MTEPMQRGAMNAEGWAMEGQRDGQRVTEWDRVRQ